jgi:hypothetical protein
MSAQTEDAVPRPVCFMVMPFRKKDTRAAAPAPSVVDFDALWDKAFFPALESLGYQPVRADQDLGALIIKEMLERLYFSDLVVADLTIPNGNVYYEIGIRHAAKGVGCVLTGADWSSPLFDVDQMRQVRYPLTEGAVTDETAAAIRQALIAAVPKLAEGASPMFQTLEGYPANVKPSREGVIRKNLDELSRFQAARREVALVPKGARRTAAIALQQRYASKPPVLPAVALEVLLVMRDYADAGDTLAYIDGLPDALKRTRSCCRRPVTIASRWQLCSNWSRRWAQPRSAWGSSAGATRRWLRPRKTRLKRRASSARQSKRTNAACNSI